MTKQPSVWMAVLLMTAIVMGVILLAAPQRQAQGVMLNAQTGYSLMTSGTPGGDEFLIVVDKTSQKLVIYSVSGNNISVMARENFGRWFAPAPGGRRN